jgi:hypothetical protein
MLLHPSALLFQEGIYLKLNSDPKWLPGTEASLLQISAFK